MESKGRLFIIEIDISLLLLENESNYDMDTRGVKMWWWQIRSNSSAFLTEILPVIKESRDNWGDFVTVTASR